jgi:Nif-specific regulatory protein
VSKIGATRTAREIASSWREQEMFLIQEVMKQVGKSLQPDQAIRGALHLMSEILGLNRGRVVLEDDEGDLFSIAYAYGLTPTEMSRGRYARGEGVTGRVIADGHIVILQDIDKDPTFLCRAVERNRLPEGPVSFLALPIRVEQRTVGVLACHRLRQSERMLADDITILRIFAILIGQLLTLLEHVKAKTWALEEQNQALARALEAGRARYGIVGTAPALLEAIAQVERVAAARASVLLLGASGTGKELFAHALHLASPRRGKPFIKVNCAAIPETLFESELFGHQRGAFTGAMDARAGWFEQASGGTIFLDEVGELPPFVQTKLLRTLQEGTVMRLGGQREIPVNVRLVAATNRDLGAAVARGAFREDLFYRLNVIPIRLPSLAERRSDIPDLIASFLSRANQANQSNVSLTGRALKFLVQQPWPGNVRQLSNFVERIVLLAGRDVLDQEDIAEFLMDHTAEPGISAVSVGGLPVASLEPAIRPYLRLESHGSEELRHALAQSSGNKTRAAQRLGLTERQFSYRWRKLGLG